MVQVAYSRQAGSSASAFSYPAAWLDKPVWVPLGEVGEEETQRTWGGDAHALAYKTGPPSIPASWQNALGNELEECHQLWCRGTWRLRAVGRHPGRRTDPLATRLVPGQLQRLGWATPFCWPACGTGRRDVLGLCCRGGSCRCSGSKWVLLTHATWPVC